eukprot:CAMPEP_0180124046 /NCGR_PEP_ID=MMETSP0986-20121125/4440_1 /TAXON_ID=697907 /ORGANISM="non described non described, Strain CCMP2293" /LENGTH=54 /DNA_ID=CAMNT_0022063355 /DNA_START=26 /DNA_END=190 /DNA_ORIENTATION=+
MFATLVPAALLKKLPGMDAGMLKLLKQAQDEQHSHGLEISGAKPAHQGDLQIDN